MDALDRKIVEHFPGKIVRKDLTSMLKRGANVPTFVLEYLLGMYCATDDETAIERGVEKIRKILAENYVRPEESEKIKSMIRERGEYTVIDKISAHLDEYNDFYVAHFANLEIEPFLIQSEYAVNYSKILMGGIWCIARISYRYPDSSFQDEKRKKKKRGPEDSPFRIVSLKPIQLPNLELEDILSQRACFSTEEWMDLLLRTEGLEPEALSEKEKLHFLERMVPLVEHNYNLCELGPRGTGKSHMFKALLRREDDDGAFEMINIEQVLNHGIIVWIGFWLGELLRTNYANLVWKAKSEEDGKGGGYVLPVLEDTRRGLTLYPCDPAEKFFERCPDGVSIDLYYYALVEQMHLQPAVKHEYRFGTQAPDNILPFPTK